MQNITWMTLVRYSLFFATGKLNGIQLTDCGYQTFFKTKKKNIVIISRRKNVWPFIEINLYTLDPRMLCAKLKLAHWFWRR